MSRAVRLPALVAVLAATLAALPAAGQAPAGGPAAAAPPVRGLGEGTGQAPRPVWLRAEPPAGWSAVPGLGRSVGKSLEQSALFGALPVHAGAAAHVQAGAGAFYLSWVAAERPAARPGEALRGAFDRLRSRRLESSSDAGSTEELRYAESAADGIARAELEWRHAANQTLSLGRTFAWLGPDGAPRLVAAECVLGTEGGAASPDAERACRGALATVAIAIAPSERSALPALPPSRAPDAVAAGAPGTPPSGPGAPPSGSGAPPSGSGAPPSGSGAPPSGSGDQATAGPVGPGRVLYRDPDAGGSGGGSRGRWLVLFGAALVAVALYFNARSRRARTSLARGEDEDSPVPGRREP